MSKNVFVTGGTGFIGINLVKFLTSRGYRVRCLVRNRSKLNRLSPYQCETVIGDLHDIKPDALEAAVTKQDWVLHLAGKTRAVRKSEMSAVNEGGLTKLLEACDKSAVCPTIVFVSSLAAAGPSLGAVPRVETDRSQPVSLYGQSKLRCEMIAERFCNQLPISVIRPPIVLGPHDVCGLTLFKSIEKTGMHLVPGFADHNFSVIHVEDLADAMVRIAERGQRCRSGDFAAGLYYASADEIVSYSELGRLIGRAVDRRSVHEVRFPIGLIWGASMVSAFVGRLNNHVPYLNPDKVRDAVAGSWCCSNHKIRHDLAFTLPVSLAERLRQTAEWYRANGWLPATQPPTPLPRKVATGGSVTISMSHHSNHSSTTSGHGLPSPM